MVDIIHKLPHLTLSALDGVVLDCETDGLKSLDGSPAKVWAIHAEYYENGTLVSSFTGRQAGFEPTNPWVLDNVWKHNADIEERENLLAEYASWWLATGQSVVWGHVVYPVETGLYDLLVQRGMISQTPYPLMDVSGLLMAAGLDPTSVDSAAKALNLDVPAGSSHDCRHDVRVMRMVMEALVPTPADQARIGLRLLVQHSALIDAALAQI